MRDNLQRPHYFEFTNSRTPFWIRDHMAIELLNMFPIIVTILS
jgi:hypothetical protein